MKRNCCLSYLFFGCIFECLTQLDEYNLVSFIPMDITDDESVTSVLAYVDTALQYGEDIEPKGV